MRFSMMLAGALAFAPVAAMAQDVEAGQRVFNQCRACHTINPGGRNGVGPNLHGIVDRAAGSVEGFRYSAPMRERAAAGLVWNMENLTAYVTDPKAIVPGGSMSYVGLRNEEQRNNLLAYIRQASAAAN
jgi:cytochrome c